jgi:hypothetical protein
MTLVDVTWSAGPNLPRPVKGQAQGVVDGRIIYACGFAFDRDGYDRPPATATQEQVNAARWPRRIRYSREAWSLDPTSGRYERLPDAPVGAFWPMGVSWGDALYMLGGTVRDARYAAQNDAWQAGEMRDLTSPRVFRLSRERGDPRTWSWSELPPLRFGRFIPGVAVFGEELYVIGGQSSFGADGYSGDRNGPHISNVEALNLAHPDRGWRHVAPLPGFARECASVAAVAGKLYAFGGFYDRLYHVPATHSRFCGDAYCYNPATRRWEQLPDLPFSLQGSPAVAVHDRYVLIFAGLRGGDQVEHPFTGDRTGRPRANLQTICYDTLERAYRLLPTPLPPAPDDSADQKPPGSDPSSVASNYWCLPKASLIGDTVYLLGGEVLDLAYSNCSDRVWIGEVVRA